MAHVGANSTHDHDGTANPKPGDPAPGPKPGDGPHPPGGQTPTGVPGQTTGDTGKS